MCILYVDKNYHTNGDFKRYTILKYQKILENSKITIR